MSFIRRSELPRLDLLRAFESAARLSSFTAAAQELALTQSAVSRQILMLEDDLGAALFERQHRAIALTDAGRLLQRAVVDSFERLRDATAALRAPTPLRQVAITTTAGFASLWLIPRLAQFTAAHPEVDVRVSATSDILDLERSRLDAAVRFLPTSRAIGTPLFEELVVPVCAPSLAADRSRPLKKASDLEQHTLLTVEPYQDEALAADWAPWLEVMGQTALRVRNTLRFTQYADVIAAAMAGQGVAIGRLPLLTELLNDGRLVMPFRGSAASQRGYYVVRSAASAGNRDADEFVAWLTEEACTIRVASPKRKAA